MRARLALFAMVLATAGLAGCGSAADPGPRAIDGGFPPRADLQALPFRIADQTGLIKAVAVVDTRAVEEGVSQVPGRDDALHLLWVGGACDRRVLVTFERTADGPAFTIDTERDFGGCRMIGIPRNLMFEFTQPVDALTVSFTVLE